MNSTIPVPETTLSVLIDQTEERLTIVPGMWISDILAANRTDVPKLVKALRRAMEGFNKVLNDSQAGCKNQDCLYCGGVNEEADHSLSEITAILEGKEQKNLGEPGATITKQPTSDS